MGTFKITSKKGSNVIGAGKHEVTIVSVKETMSKGNPAKGWLPVPQVEIQFRDAKKQTLTAYYNTVTFMKNEDGSYALDRKGQRQLDPNNISMDILAKLAGNAGIEETDEEFAVTDLIGYEVGIAVVSETAVGGKSDGKDFSRVKFSYALEAEEVEEVEQF